MLYSTKMTKPSLFYFIFFNFLYLSCRYDCPVCTQIAIKESCMFETEEVFDRVSNEASDGIIQCNRKHTSQVLSIVKIFHEHFYKDLPSFLEV